ncbi:zinc finger CCHC domain-containing protein 7-like [Chanos chanos]|uniref:Zinc finger CCHC domain-containing protein 7 n=1 Tax=Chanos chanos TaxID=29144 RepID=A0A6J2X120_CHACN|nr:zinc finger CCHC domain-containing protein 7-like [Chanos chanos]
MHCEYVVDEEHEYDSWSFVSSDRSPDLSWPDSELSSDSADERGSEEGSEGESDFEIEHWMILGEEEEEADRTIQLNLSYSCSDTDDEKNEENYNTKLWVVSEKDRESGSRGGDKRKDGEFSSRTPRYFPLQEDLFCSNCRKRGHKTWSCPAPKRQMCCVLCGQRGHLLSACPQQHCPVCGLLTHTLTSHKQTVRTQLACPLQTYCDQPCSRCGRSGHLQDSCPDSWRQYHLTTQHGVPVRPECEHTRRQPVYCYNCALQGHYGHECMQKRMQSGVKPSVPYVCVYDSEQDLQIRQAQTLSRATGLQQLCLEGSQKAKQQRGQTWPEKRRKRREIKKLRKERKSVGGIRNKEPESLQSPSVDITFPPQNLPVKGHTNSGPRRSAQSRHRKSYHLGRHFVSVKRRVCR